MLQRPMEMGVRLVEQDDGRLAQMNESKEINELLKSAAGHEYIKLLRATFLQIGEGNIPIVCLIELDVDFGEVRENASKDFEQKMLTIVLLEVEQQVAYDTVDAPASQSILNDRRRFALFLGEKSGKDRQVGDAQLAKGIERFGRVVRAVQRYTETIVGQINGDRRFELVFKKDLNLDDSVLAGGLRLSIGPEVNRIRTGDDVKVFRGNGTAFDFKAAVLSTEAVVNSKIKQSKSLKQGGFAAIVWPNQAVKGFQFCFKQFPPLEVFNMNFSNQHRAPEITLAATPARFHSFFAKVWSLRVE